MTDITVVGQPSQIDNANDRFGRNLNIFPATGYADQLAITAGTPQNYTIPTGLEIDYLTIKATGNANVFSKVNLTTGTKPTGNITNGTAWDYNIGAIKLDGVTSIRFDADVSCTIILTAFSQ